MGRHRHLRHIFFFGRVAIFQSFLLSSSLEVDSNRRAEIEMEIFPQQQQIKKTAIRPGTSTVGGTDDQWERGAPFFVKETEPNIFFLLFHSFAFTVRPVSLSVRVDRAIFERQ